MSMFATAAGLSVSASGFSELPTTADFQAAMTFEGHGWYKHQLNLTLILDIQFGYFMV